MADPVQRIDPAGTSSAEKGVLSGRIGQIAAHFERRPGEIRKAIHAVKRAARMPDNPDVLIDLTTGEVYPEAFLAEGGIGDSIGNIFEFLL